MRRAVPAGVTSATSTLVAVLLEVLLIYVLRIHSQLDDGFFGTKRLF